jgi:DNA-binding helix-hairpin-helix protein with protein kinase domain
MSTVTATIFRGNANQHRVAASEESLANRRELHERSAMAWDEMAQALEDTVELAKVNAVAKAKAKAEAELLHARHQESIGRRLVGSPPMDGGV